MRTKKNILYHTFVGLTAEIENSTSRDMIGIKGTIIYETKNTFVMNINGNRKIIQKKPNVFRLHLDDGSIVSIRGSAILYNPIERPKKVNKRKALV